MIWLLAYLLFGFVLHFCLTQILHYQSDVGWRWELAATLLWPIAIVCGIWRMWRRDRLT